MHSQQLEGTDATTSRGDAATPMLVDKLNTPQRAGSVVAGGQLASPAYRKPPSQVSRLLVIAREADLFVSFDEEPFVVARIGERKETLLLRGDAFKGWIQDRYSREHQGAASMSALQAAVDQLAGNCGHHLA